MKKLKKLDSRVVYENPWIRVREDKVRRFDGSEGIYAVIETTSPGGVAVVCIKDGKFLMIRQHRYTLDKVANELVAGCVKEGEDFLDAAKRELFEEAGFKGGKWKHLGCFDEFTGVCNAQVEMFLVMDPEFVGGQEVSSCEDIESFWVGVDEATGMVEKGEISNLLSVAGILMAWRCFCSG